MSEPEKVTPERVAALRVLCCEPSRGVAFCIAVPELLSVIDELSQSVENLLAVAEKDTDVDGYITAYHFKTGVLHRLLARTRSLSPGVLQNVAVPDELLRQQEIDAVDVEARRLDAPLVGDSGDAGCYARSGKRCEGYFSMGCRHCGRIIGSVRSLTPEIAR